MSGYDAHRAEIAALAMRAIATMAVMQADALIAALNAEPQA